MVNNIKHSYTGSDHIRAKTIYNNKNNSKAKQTSHSAWSHGKNIRVSNNTVNQSEGENKFNSWFLNIINPTNHLPVIGTIKKLHNKAAQSLDLVQSMIGGMIYGGPLGVVKGLGSWLAGKFISHKKIANKPLEVPKKIENNSKNIINEKTSNLGDKNLNDKILNLKISENKINIQKKTNESLKYSSNQPLFHQNRNKVLESYSEKKIKLSKSIILSA